MNPTARARSDRQMIPLISSQCALLMRQRFGVLPILKVSTTVGETPANSIASNAGLLGRGAILAAVMP